MQVVVIILLLKRFIKDQRTLQILAEYFMILKFFVQSGRILKTIIDSFRILQDPAKNLADTIAQFGACSDLSRKSFIVVL